MIRAEAGMPTSRFCEKFGIPERTWRRWQAKARQQRPPRGPWPQPARVPIRDVVLKHALAHPAWGHRKVWAMVRHEGRLVSQLTVLRILREEGLILTPAYQAERRQLAEIRKTAFADPPTAPNHVWQLDFTEIETTSGGTWRIAACRDYWSKYELGWHISPTANQHDAIASIELAIVEAESLLGCSILESMADPVTGELIGRPVTIVTDNGGPFRSDRFARFVDRPDLHHVRTRVRSPGQNGSRERGFGTLKYERLFLEEIRDGIELRAAAEAYRIEYNKVRPHEALSWNRPYDVHTGVADPVIPNFSNRENPATCLTRDIADGRRRLTKVGYVPWTSHGLALLRPLAADRRVL